MRLKWKGVQKVLSLLLLGILYYTLLRCQP